MSLKTLPLAMAKRNKAFFCYSAADRKILKELLDHLAPLVNSGAIETFHDMQIQAGELWLEQIMENLATARVAVLLISIDFLGSKFVMEIEVPELLKRAEREGVVILPVIVRHCLFEATPQLNQFQAINHGEPLSELKRPKRERALVDIARAIHSAMSR